MSLDSNTTELNEILDMAKNLPEAGGGEGGEAVQEVYHVKAFWDLLSTTASLEISVDELFAVALGTPKRHIILDVIYSDFNTFFLPMIYADIESLVFTATAYVGDGLSPFIAAVVNKDGTITINLSDESSQSDAQKVFYVDCDMDLSTFSIPFISKHYAEIVKKVEAGAYVVLRGNFAMVAEPTNIAYFPLSAFVKEAGFLMFTGTVQLSVGGTMALVSFVMQLYENDSIDIKVRVVSATDIK